jgi:hypothetical protein
MTRSNFIGAHSTVSSRLRADLSRILYTTSFFLDYFRNK